MEFKGIKIDLNGLAMLITAITAAYTTYRGVKQNKKNRVEKAKATKEGDSV